ncbi:elongator complex ELP3 [Babesia ovis]|uniref:tRNA carboxymethyluridine synthase n=1 Tax=Babesia ovis TaxID=5869 RepID=A0A9W5TES9_BABOV|nr:elongator complex ELP3 [Babesia ovis]
MGSSGRSTRSVSSRQDSPMTGDNRSSSPADQDQLDTAARIDLDQYVAAASQGSYSNHNNFQESIMDDPTSIADSETICGDSETLAGDYETLRDDSDTLSDITEPVGTPGMVARRNGFHLNIGDGVNLDAIMSTTVSTVGSSEDAITHGRVSFSTHDVSEYIDSRRSPTEEHSVSGTVPPHNTPIELDGQSHIDHMSSASPIANGTVRFRANREIDPVSDNDSLHGSVGHLSDENDSDEEMRNFFPATREGFEEVAGKVTRVTRADFGDFHRRRHLECFARSMDHWRNFDSNEAQDSNVPLYSELQFDRYDDIFVNMDVNTMSPLDQFIYQLLSVSETVHDQDDLTAVMAKLRRQFRISPSKRDIFERLLQLQRDADQNRGSTSELPPGVGAPAGDTAKPTPVRYDPKMQHLLRNKCVRSNSGVVVITVLTAPGNFSCSADCYYCPNEPGQPRSYLSTEPAVLRANQNDFDAARQFYDRAMTLYRNGHVIDKIEVLVLGGTWSGYPREYQERFCRDLYYAANIFPSPLETARPRETIRAEQDMNVKASCRIIGLTLETRPDRITPAEIRILRNLGCTRVQLGIQHTNDDILNHVNRGHGIAEGVRALYLLKENCYKVDIHLMPDLPSSSPQMDLEMFEMVLGDETLQADQWKIYPCEVTPFSRIEQWHKEGRYVSYFDTDPDLLMNLLMRVKRAIHPWIRLNRVIRDIPNPSIIAGTNVTNMRQLLLSRMTKRGLMCRCIRCREMKKGSADLGARLMVRQYRSTGGDEYFLSYESEDESKIFGFLRLRLRDHVGHNPRVSMFRCLEGCALIRELHVYGVVVVHGKSSKEATPYQHRGIGASLLLTAEILAAAKGFRKMAVIAGIGTREYYAKHGYEIEDTFMTKHLCHQSIYDRFVTHKATGSAIQIPYSIKVYQVDLQDSVKVLHQPLPAEPSGKQSLPLVCPATRGPTYYINVFRFLRHSKTGFNKTTDYTTLGQNAFDRYWSYFDCAYDSLSKYIGVLQERPFVVASVAFLGFACYVNIRRRSQM